MSHVNNYLSVPVLSILMLALSLTTTVAAPAKQLADHPEVINKRPVALSDEAEQFLKTRGEQSAVVWLYFTDKNVFTQDDYQRAAAEVIFSEKVLSRRAKAGINDVLFIDLPVFSQYVEAVIDLGGDHRRTSRWLNAASFEIPWDLLDQTGALPFVAYIEPVVFFKRDEVPIDSEIQDDSDSSSGEERTLDYGQATSQLNQINVPPVHDKGFTGLGVTLAIFDTGFRKSHEVFAQHYTDGRVLAEYDFVFNDGNTANEPIDASSQWDHGTLIWSVSGGYNPGVLIGPAYQANFLLAKTEDVRSETQVEEDNWVAAVEWADSLGADVITSSLAYSDWYSYSDLDGQTAVTTIAANLATSLGIVVCNAMANSGPGAGTLHAPADAFEILACGAVSSSGSIASFSSRGPTFDGRTKPEVCARGVSTAAATSSSDISYGSASGTSLSTPLVAGAACLLVQARPTFPPQLIRAALMETADNAATPDNNLGWGVINIDAALSWGASFTTDTTIGEAPLTVQFTGASTVTVSSWLWDFGDGFSSSDQSPVHTFISPGAFTVSLTVGSVYGPITTVKADHILIVADTLFFVSDSAFAGDSMTMSVHLTNAIELDRILVPFEYGGDIDLDFLLSVEFGERTEYFEYKAIVAIDNSNERYAIELATDLGTDQPPLPPGSGEVFRLNFRINSLELGGLGSLVDTTSQLPKALKLITGTAAYAPVVFPGTISTIWIKRGDCNYNGFIDIIDIVHLVNYFFSVGPPPVTIQAGDADASLGLTLLDIIYLVDYLFRGGPPPVTP